VFTSLVSRRRVRLQLIGLTLAGCVQNDDIGESETDDVTATATATAGTGETLASTGDVTSAGSESTSPGTTSDGTTSDGTTSDGTTGVIPEGCSDDAVELVMLVNAYRSENGKPAIPLAPSLCMVGDTHVQDLADNNPDAAPECNLHSWSNAGSWSPCCYTADHAQAQCMWDKPTELTSYPGNGYENASRGAQSPAAALDLWKASPGHNDVILSQGIWSDYPWGAIGAGFHGGYAVLWFGQEADSAG